MWIKRQSSPETRRMGGGQPSAFVQFHRNDPLWPKKLDMSIDNLGQLSKNIISQNIDSYQAEAGNKAEKGLSL